MSVSELLRWAPPTFDCTSNNYSAICDFNTKAVVG